MTDAVRRRSTRVPKIIAIAGLAGMLVLWVLEVQALTWESGDRVLHLNYIGIAVCVVISVAAALWIARSTRRAGAIVVLVVSILINPIWLLLLIRALG
ncbi:ABC-type spermidine/putrescine transport system permease subunit I [Microbacteriaceae bacterium SG_E_30_P1]|uniref:ABC-type spermidine/putrescine transport system permease subunit I n=1 Tax=Antiquaquibacter oligotrophicus TaxID=2880260 RepID=A0ABT6KKR4_9MICO|nr:hypothetical protein [Antiquaquibacter oligotrophicus]MDH6180600.1 ABC-type spermidine/putrescine transport system permease subunit I [Antiquaquibacter oligotrophicus]UDF13667.1 hypothetical protein LH407_02100 [Antiquaquibacter oligotrophicus]